MAGASQDALGQLAEWDTPALSNALQRMGLLTFGSGYTDGSIVRVAGQVLCGTAVTARMRARASGDEAVPVAELHRAVLGQQPPVVVVVQDEDEPPGAGAFLGEVNGTLLAALRISGFVTNGRVRDVNELRQMGYAAHARGLAVARAHMRLTAVNVPVTVAGLHISPGDLLHGDEHGVLRIPAEAMPKIVTVASEIREEEQEIVRWARSDKFTSEDLLALKRVRH